MKEAAKKENEGDNKTCDVMNLKKIMERCKRYDPGNSKRKSSKVKLQVQMICPTHGSIKQEDAIFDCNTP